MRKRKVYLSNQNFFLKLLIIFLTLLLLSNCAEEPCIGAEDTGQVSVFVPANPRLAIDTGYRHDTTGQRASWLNIGYLTNGDAFEIEIAGDWTPWFGDEAFSELYTADKDCTITTINKNAERFDIDGEYDYINDYKYINKETRESILLAPKDQNACVLRGGQGLYIGFFGPDGLTTPKIAHHLKTTSIKCPDLYWHNENNNNTVEPGECYKEGKSSENRTIIEDKSIYVYKTAGFYKNTKRNYVGPNEVVKLVILDRYYSDNEGGYDVRFLKGVGSKDKGSLEKLMEEFEKVFLGKYNYMTEKWEGGILMKIYNAIILDNAFTAVIRFALVFYIITLGFNIMTGSSKLTQKELLVRMLKLSLVIAVTSPNGWYFFNNYIADFFIRGVYSATLAMASIIDRAFTISEQYIATQGRLDRFSGAARFAYFDDVIQLFFSREMFLKSLGLVSNFWFGFLLAIAMFILIIAFIIILIMATYPYVISLGQIALALSLAPIFFVLFLFKRTEGLFKKWVVFICARFFEITLLFSVLYLMTAAVKNKIIGLVNFDTCQVPLKMFFQNKDMKAFLKGLLLHNMPIWRTRSNMNFQQCFIEVFTIVLFLVVFKYIINNILMISNSLFKVWGEKNKFKGSGLGQTFYGAMPSIIRNYLTKRKDQLLTIPKKLITETPQKIREGIMKSNWYQRAKTVGVTLGGRRLGGGKTPELIRQAEQKADEAGLKGLARNKFIRKAVGDSLDSSKERKFWKERFEHLYVDRPFKKEIKQVYKNFKEDIKKDPLKYSTTSKSNLRLAYKNYVKNHMENWVQKNSPNENIMLLDRYKNLIKKEIDSRYDRKLGDLVYRDTLGKYVGTGIDSLDKYKKSEKNTFRILAKEGRTDALKMKKKRINKIFAKEGLRDKDWNNRTIYRKEPKSRLEKILGKEERKVRREHGERGTEVSRNVRKETLMEMNNAIDDAIMDSKKPTHEKHVEIFRKMEMHKKKAAKLEKLIEKIRDTETNEQEKEESITALRKEKFKHKNRTYKVEETILDILKEEERTGKEESRDVARKAKAEVQILEIQKILREKQEKETESIESAIDKARDPIHEEHIKEFSKLNNEDSKKLEKMIKEIDNADDDKKMALIVKLEEENFTVKDETGTEIKIGEDVSEILQEEIKVSKKYSEDDGEKESFKRQAKARIKILRIERRLKEGRGEDTKEVEKKLKDMVAFFEREFR